MAVTTVDVVTNVTPASETIKNATTVVNCYRTGAFSFSNATYQQSVTYNTIESKYTLRFDDVGYYNSVDGGNS
jgi:hypothetical protein